VYVSNQELWQLNTFNFKNFMQLCINNLATSTLTKCVISWVFTSFLLQIKRSFLNLLFIQAEFPVELQQTLDKFQINARSVALLRKHKKSSLYVYLIEGHAIKW